MRPRLIDLAVAFAALAAGSATAAPGKLVPITVQSATVEVHSTGGVATGSGALLLDVPFDFVGTSCSASGLLSATLVDGGLQIDISGTATGGGCGINFETLAAVLNLSVPNLGSPMTPVFLSGVVLETPGDLGTAGGRINTLYASAALGRVALDFPEQNGTPFKYFLDLRVANAGDRQSSLMSLLPGDSVSLEPPGLFSAS